MTGSPKKALQGGGGERGGEEILGKVSNTQGNSSTCMGEKLGKTYVYCYLDIISIVLWIL